MNTINHIGLTLAIALPAEYIIRQRLTSGRRRKQAKWLRLAGIPAQLANRLSPSVYFDFRLVMIGSILPDILDKPMGFFLARELLNGNLRTIGHGGLFALTFLIAALAVHFILRNPQLLVMAVVSAGHMVMDQMWTQPGTLLWPLFGLEFPIGQTTFSEYITFHLHGLLRPQPMDFIAAGIILGLLIYVVISSGITIFLKSGKVLPVRPV